MDPILQIAEKHGLKVIEDAAQAHGATYKKQVAGSMGNAGCFSFYPGKNLGAFGEAGAVVTSDPVVADKVRMLRDHGQPKKYLHTYVGWNSRMDGIQAAVLSVKLKYLDAANEARRAHAKHYTEALKGLRGLITPLEAECNKHVYHLYAVRVKNRDDLMSTLADKGISCGIHYPISLHLQEAYRELGYSQGDFPVSEKCTAEEVSLPMYPELSAEQVDYVVRGLSEYLLDAEATMAPAS
jgi:dTDP-4-amino-4,6-dideoxygalactose transaminase